MEKYAARHSDDVAVTGGRYRQWYLHFKNDTFCVEDKTFTEMQNWRFYLLNIRV